MKKMLFLFLAILACMMDAQAQCVRDSNLLITGDLFSPAPYTPDSAFYNLREACIGTLYNQSVTINVPSNITVSGITVPVSNVSIATSGAINNLPVGTTYTCDPPNCVFNANTIGCILLRGTPTAANTAPDTLDLRINATVSTPFGPLPIEFPGNQAAPNDHYYLILKPMGTCNVSSTAEANSLFSQVQMMPNPFTAQTTLEVEALEAGNYRFEVFDLLGKRMHSQNVQLQEGINQFNYDGSVLPKGIYLYAIGTGHRQSMYRFLKM
ncbi:MAG: T9SS type A sorting domain-containing protein [Saprospiraceae bacterium]|nr:T9SS type A sorting domain-containing protein [Saprospiraceae bacterium]